MIKLKKFNMKKKGEFIVFHKNMECFMFVISEPDIDAYHVFADKEVVMPKTFDFTQLVFIGEI